MRVAVTGGAGYIGSVVTELLHADGHEVMVIDNLSKGYRDAVPASVPLFEIDLRDTNQVSAALRDFTAEAVIHMAASSLVGESVGEPARYYDNNMRAGLALLDAMRICDVRRLVFSSTAAVYGEPEQQPIVETARVHPTNPYGETKLAFERALPWYAGAYGLSATSLRYFNAAGATAERGERHEPETHLIPLALAVAAGRRSRLTVFGEDYQTPDGTCIRDYIHVADLARAHVLALAAMTADGACYTYNLGCGGRGYSVREVIASVVSVTGRPVAVDMAPRRSGDPAVLVASSDTIRRDLSWSPQFTDLDAIVASAWAWMVARGQATGS